MDVAMALQTLLPAPLFKGAIQFNTEEEYNSLVWLDPRIKPTWAEITAKDAELAQDAKQNPPKTLAERIGALETVVAALKAKAGI